MISMAKSGYFVLQINTSPHLTFWRLHCICQQIFIQSATQLLCQELLLASINTSWSMLQQNTLFPQLYNSLQHTKTRIKDNISGWSKVRLKQSHEEAKSFALLVVWQIMKFLWIVFSLHQFIYVSNFIVPQLMCDTTCQKDLASGGKKHNI